MDDRDLRARDEEAPKAEETEEKAEKKKKKKKKHKRRTEREPSGTHEVSRDRRPPSPDESDGDRGGMIWIKVPRASLQAK